MSSEDSIIEEVQFNQNIPHNLPIKSQQYIPKPLPKQSIKNTQTSYINGHPNGHPNGPQNIPYPSMTRTNTTHSNVQHSNPVNPITINNNIPELKLNNEQSYDIPNYVSSLIILTLGCLTLNPCLLLVNPCLNSGANYKNHKQAVMLSTIFGIILGLIWIILGIVYLVLLLMANGNN